MENMALSTRSTFRYADGWDFLDGWTDAGTARITPMRQLTPRRSHEEGPTYVAHARIPRGQDPTASRQALEDLLSGTRCRCIHDCCGCATRTANVTRIGKRRFLIRVAVHYNY